MSDPDLKKSIPAPCAADDDEQNEALLISEAQLILAEKRTSLSVMRTGIAVLVLPLSVLSVLVATSKFYDVSNILHLFIALLILCGLLVAFGIYLIIRSYLHLRRQDRMINCLKKKHSRLAGFIE